MKKIINPWDGLDGYMCYGCSPSNPLGLQMEFYEDGDDIVSFWKPDRYKQSWLNVLHGGIQSTLLDEIGGWIISRKLQTTGVTSRLEVRFIKSISTEEPQLVIRGRIKEQKRNAVFMEAEIYNSKEEMCARADIVYFIVDKQRSHNDFHFCGCKTEDE